MRRRRFESSDFRLGPFETEAKCAPERRGEDASVGRFCWTVPRYVVRVGRVEGGAASVKTGLQEATSRDQRSAGDRVSVTYRMRHLFYRNLLLTLLTSNIIPFKW